MNQDLVLSRTFFKGHGHGNDYLVFEEGDDWLATPENIRAMCHPHRGVGGDGIVALLRRGPRAEGEGLPDANAAPGPPFRLRMFNPDGSEFERSGNGLRVLGAYLFHRKWVVPGRAFPVEVGGDRVAIEVLGQEEGGLLELGVEMGEARFGMTAVGGREEDLAADGSLPGPDGEPLLVQPVSVGNPHCVVFRDVLSEEELRTLGPFLTSHPAFPRGVNVQLARAVDEKSMEILIWERGVGRTSSSGTSACAAAAAFVRRGILESGPITVLMEGGAFTVRVSPEARVRLEGPVQSVFLGKLTSGLVESLA